MPRKPSPRAASANGYVLVELIGALVIVIIVTSMFLHGTRPVPGDLAAGTTRQIRAALAASLADAEVEGGDVEVKVDATQAGDRRGRILALAGPAGVTTASVPSAQWLELLDGVAWRPGTAVADPFGVPTDGRIPGTVRCDPDECSTGRADYVVYYVGHVRAPRVGWAIVLGRDRELRTFRWDHASSSWKADAE